MSLLRILVLTALFSNQAAQASEIWAEVENFIKYSDSAEVEVWVDFTDNPTLGGCFSLEYDSSALLATEAVQDSLPGVVQSGPVFATGAVNDWCFQPVFSGFGQRVRMGTISFTYLETMCATTSFQMKQGSVGFISQQTGFVQAVDYLEGGLYRSDFDTPITARQIVIKPRSGDFLKVSEVVAMSAGKDVAQARLGATAVGDGSGAFPGTTGGANHADNVIDGRIATAFPDLFHSDTTSDAEFLRVTLDQTYAIEELNVYGPRGAGEDQLYDILFLDTQGAQVKVCERVSANNDGFKAITLTPPASFSVVPRSYASLMPGDIFTVDLVADYHADPIIGSGLRLAYDSDALEVLDAQVNPDVGEPQFTFDLLFTDDAIDDWSLGAFRGLRPLFRFGDATFRVLEPMCGSTLLDVMPTMGIGGPPVSAMDFTTVPPTDYFDASTFREFVEPVEEVEQIVIRPYQEGGLHVSEVVAISGGVDVATLAEGAIASGDGTGAFPGTTGGAAHADNAIDGIGPAAFPDLFYPDTTSVNEFLRIDLPSGHTIDGLSVLGRTDCCGELDVYDVELIGGQGEELKTCSGQSANNLDFAAAVIPFDLSADADGDGVDDAVDNCVTASNAAQIDADSDNIGNACDADLNGDCVTNVLDLGLLRSVFFTDDRAADFNADGVVNVQDLGIMRALFFTAPGPSALANACSD